ncbi:hypothetical protein JCM10213_000540 [Rhodosporidiobolus nylandii]
MAPSIRSFRGSSRPPPSAYNRPPSPTGSATTQASQLNLGDEGPRVVVTRADLRESVAAYEQLLASAKGYRNALIALSSASTALAGALGECARVKGAGDSGEQLMAASGLHYMVAGNGQVLSDTLYRSFEVPLMTAYDSYVGEIAARHADYEELLAQKTQAIRETEAENMRQGRKKNRDLNQFRIALAKLTEQVAEVEVCKRSYYSEVLENETEMWGMIGGKVSLLVRSTLDLADRLASKATADPIIESMLDEHPDPFNSYQLETDEERDVFSILPPINLSIAGNSAGNSPSAAARKAQATAAAAEADKEAIRSRDKEREQEDAPTPRRLSKTPTTVSDVLGLNQVSDDDEDESPSAPSRSRHTPTQDAAAVDVTPSSTPLHSRSRSGSQPQPLPSTSSSPSPASAAADSPALSPSATPALSCPRAYDPPSLTMESAPFATLSRQSSSASTAPSVAPASPTKQRRARGLSRVSEQEQDADLDEMAGDWGAPVYGRQLSSAVNGGGGYDSAEDEGAWRG